MRPKDLLTDAAPRNAKPGGKDKKLSDGGGLYLLVTPTGGKWWRFKYRFGGKEKLLSFGTYPEVSLKKAREKREEARKQVAAGIDPGEQRKAEKATEKAQAAEAKAIEENTFEKVAREWFNKFSPSWVPSHADKIIRRLERDFFPWLGNRPIREITESDLLEALGRIEERGAIETARRALQNCEKIFRYAAVTQRTDKNPAIGLGEYLTSVEQKSHAAIIDPKAIGGLLRAIDAYKGFLVVKCALRLAPLLFVRPGELRKAEWAEIDLDRAEWNIPAERMKMKRPHLVPLSRQAVEILQELRALTGSGRYVFPGARSNGRPMSENSVNAALRSMGYTSEEMTGHGFRAMARTILDEVLQVRPDFIEHQLAHAVRDPNGRAYNRTAHLAERRKMMQTWADYLDGLKAVAKVIPLHRVA